MSWMAPAGSRQVFLCGLVQYSNLVGTAIGYTVTSSISMVYELPKLRLELCCPFP